MGIHGVEEVGAKRQETQHHETRSRVGAAVGVSQSSWRGSNNQVGVDSANPVDYHQIITNNSIKTLLPRKQVRAEIDCIISPLLIQKN